MLVRDQVAAALAASLEPGVRVVPYQRVVDNLTGPLCMVGISSVVPDELLPHERRRYTVTVSVLVATTDPGAADDDVDALLEDVLAAIDADLHLAWSTAERASFSSSPNSPATFPGYDVTLLAHVNIDDN